MNKPKKTRSFSIIQSAKKKILRSPKILEQILGARQLHDILQCYEVEFRDRMFSPIATIWVFVTQILNSDQSCRAAVAQYLSTLRLRTCSLATGAYCQARKRLKVEVLRTLLLTQAEQLQSHVQADWLWKGRKVKLVDGTTVSMPDTEDNRFHFPATNKKKNPAEFPIARVLVIICKTSGILLNAAIGPYQGKGSGETSMLKQLYSSFKAGDIALFDRYYSGFFTFAGLMSRGVDCVSRQHHLRKITPTKRLGKNDHLFIVKRSPKPKDMSQKEYDSYPCEILLRRVRVSVIQVGFRTRKLDVITTQLDESYLPEEIAELYKHRWLVEVDIRTIKTVMGMDVLRCHTAEMVKKEIWMHFFAYNLVRTVIMDAAKLHSKEPRDLSFKAALQMIFSFRNSMVTASHSEWNTMYTDLLIQLKHQIVGNRPNRYEPRRKKRRENVKYLAVSRLEARQSCLKQAA